MAASEHQEEHGHEHGHEHEHGHGGGPLGWLGAIFHMHGHAGQREALASDAAFAANEEGIRTVWLALGALSLTTVLQFVVALISGSVALLADTIHNLGDALNSIPLLVAFYLARRVPTRRYTYGFGKAEDVAGIFIVLSIVASAAIILYESARKLMDPAPSQQLGWVAAAAVIGFLGNEAVALLQIRTGRRIGSAALVADGMHARTDGLTSLAVLLAAICTALGFPVADPIIGIVIGLAIMLIARDATVTLWYRLMDAVDPELVDQIERAASKTEGVEGVHGVRVRWLGHRLNAELHVVVDQDLPTHASHAITEAVRHALLHELPQLAAVHVHVDPCGHGAQAALAHHDKPGHAHDHA